MTIKSQGDIIMLHILLGVKDILDCRVKLLSHDPEKIAQEFFGIAELNLSRD
jgi:hypothetical protein